ncbi:serine/threonine-protein kinase [Sinosporangium siamense]|uniref:non-specific serine/threonine protein kinase n=1 Tax=Sinosporangium siamense TaxID=1367973 RepID=A0A919VF74_9ACTN|nr:serine/threonine-protein kinase [Sinosporangium siamense]GII95854.1 hypothetical protein Ssi02_60850 [Sinosporangium siamense]
MTPEGQLLGNRYLLLDSIAAGGMGEVWRARDQLLGREVAVKLLRRHMAADPMFRHRFRTEAQIAAGLADPGIAQVFDYGEENGGAYLVMELVHGEPLSAILARNGSLSVPVALDVLAQTAHALQAAHSAGFIHRDIKPGNLLVTEAGLIKITDFGIARALEAAPVTQTGTVVGTVQYVSPEQASGLTLTPSTDLYSLGVVAYECLAGRAPFTSDNQVALALQHINNAPPPLPADVPREVAELVMACLAKDPERRPRSARELSDRALALRDSPATGGTHLRTLTDPAGWRTQTGPAAGVPGPLPYSPELVAGRTGGLPPVPDEPGLYHPTQFSGVPEPGTHLGRARQRRKRARTMLVAAGCAAAMGLGAVAISTMGSPPIGEAEPAPPSSSPTVKKPPAKSRTPEPRTTTVRPKPTRSTPSPSATVSTSVSPSPEPTPTPTMTPTPTPTINTPSPTPSTTPSITPDPGDTDPPKAET